MVRNRSHCLGQMLKHYSRDDAGTTAGCPPANQILYWITYGMFGNRKADLHHRQLRATGNPLPAHDTRSQLFGLESLYIKVAITFAASSTGNCDHFDCAI